MPSREYYERSWEAFPEHRLPQLAAVRRRFLIDRLVPGEEVLDIGCGDGWFAAEMIAADIDVLGADVAEEALARARARNPRLRLALVEEESLPFADASFDAVWAGEVLEHVVDTAAWLSEVRRVLRPRGRLLVSTPAHDFLTLAAFALRPKRFDAHLDPRGEHLRFYTRRTLRSLLEDLRFGEVVIDGAGGVPGARACLLASATRARF